VNVHITGLAGPGYISGADNCSIWLDRDPDSDPNNPTGGGPADSGGVRDFNKLGAAVGDHTVHIRCYHAGHQTAFWNAERDVTVVASGASPQAQAAAPAQAAPPAPAASAGAQVSGTYTVKASDGSTSTWTITSCGPGCLHIVSSQGGSVNAQLVNGRWTFPLHSEAAVLCPDGAKVAADAEYSFDPASLTGWIDTTDSAGCAGHGGTNALPPPLSFNMTKVG
jgi:hypothetical protein